MKTYCLTKKQKSDLVGLYLACGYTVHNNNYRVIFNIPMDKKQIALEAIKPFNWYSHSSDIAGGVKKVRIISKWLYELLHPLGNCRKAHKGNLYTFKSKFNSKDILNMYTAIRGGVYERRDGKYMLRLESKNEKLVESLSFLINKTPLQKLRGKDILNRQVKTKYFNKNYSFKSHFVQSYYDFDPKKLLRS